MNTDYDGAWKEALDTLLPYCILLFFPDLYELIDWSRGYEALDKELLQIQSPSDSGTRSADKIYRVFLRDGGQEAWLPVHIEIQSQRDPALPKRIFVTNYRVHDHFDRMAISLAVLADEEPGWRPTSYELKLARFRVGIDYMMVKLLDYAGRAAELEASDNPFAAVVLAHLKTQETHRSPESRLSWKFRIVRALYDRGWSRERVEQLFRIIDWLMSLPTPLELEFRQAVIDLEKEKQVPYITSIERIAAQEGELRGELRGEERGEERGMRKSLIESILDCIETRFSVAVPAEIKAALEATPELSTLKQHFRTALKVSTLSELSQALLQPPPNSSPSVTNP